MDGRRSVTKRDAVARRRVVQPRARHCANGPSAASSGRLLFRLKRESREHTAQFVGDPGSGRQMTPLTKAQQCYEASANPVHDYDSSDTETDDTDELMVELGVNLADAFAKDPAVTVTPLEHGRLVSSGWPEAGELVTAASDPSGDLTDLDDLDLLSTVLKDDGDARPPAMVAFLYAFDKLQLVYL